MTSALMEPTINLRVPAGGRFRHIFTAQGTSGAVTATISEETYA